MQQFLQVLASFCSHCVCEILKHFLLFLEHLNLLSFLLLLQLKHFLSPFFEPLRVSLYFAQRYFLSDTALAGIILPFFELLGIHQLIFTVHLPHFLDFVEINDKAALICMVLLDALPTEYCQMIRAVKMLYSLVMFFTEQGLRLEVFILEIDISENVVTLDYFIQNVEVKRQLINSFDLLHKFPADWTSNPIVIMQLGKTLGAKSVTTVNQNSWYPLTYIEFFSAEVTKVKTTSFVICLEEILIPTCCFSIIQLLFFLRALFL